MITIKSTNIVATDDSLPLARPLSPRRDGYCDHCGARLNAVRVSIWEIVGACFCASLSLMLLVLALYCGYRWTNHDGSGLSAHPVWLEPLDDWSL
jgi:hypothetical protein